MTTVGSATSTSKSDTSLASASNKVGGALGKDAFLQLLVASMRYQDPSKPTDSQQYMAQLAQFTQVEKLETISTSQADASRWQRTVAGQAMIGCTVTGPAVAGGPPVKGLVTGVSLSASGPLLQLAGGGTLKVEDVTEVDALPAAAGTASTATPPATGA